MSDPRFQKALSHLDAIIRDWEDQHPGTIADATALNWRLRKISIVRGVLRDLQEEIALLAPSRRVETRRAGFFRREPRVVARRRFVE